MKFCVTFLVLLVANGCYGILNRDLYGYVNMPGSSMLQRGDEESKLVKLNAPIFFYTEKYDSVYINTNGILTFGNEFPEYLNIPFPIEYPAISPFYTNIDLTYGNESHSINYYQSTDEILLNRASNVIRTSFSDASSFRASSLFVVTYKNVPKWQGEKMSDGEYNTFQLAVISNNEESFVQYLYPQNGINWIQAEVGESGLPDIRARAGFVAADGRFTLLKGSGSDNVRYLSETSNFGSAGLWLYRVGPLTEDENVEEPDAVKNEEDNEATNCANGGRLQCHSAAMCKDLSNGFCCTCKEGYYGNGYSCIKNNIPIRVTGSITGHIGSASVASQLQAYVVMADGRVYTAISPVTSEIGPKMQLLQNIGGVIGWLFAKPLENKLNGYQITGGKFNHTTNLRFEGSEKVLHITQRYTGLNLWDQLAAEIEISGDVPDIPEGVKVSMDDFVEEYSSTQPDMIKTVSMHKALLSSGAPDIVFTVFQETTFEICPYVDQAYHENTSSGRLKTSKITLGYHSQENAVRIGAVSKVGVSDKTNPCEEGTANCGDNTVCVPTNDDNYECQCKNGYTYSGVENSEGVETCVDIDECSTSHICAEDARCYNEPGGYNCVCNPGFEGNGYDCREVRTMEATTHYPYHAATCTDCSDNAYCSEGVCTCKRGYIGNGYDCQNICGPGSTFDGQQCVRIATNEDFEVPPTCTQQGCICPNGYNLVQYSTKTVCVLIEFEDEEPQQTVSCDVINSCSPFANCEFNNNQYKYECVCGSGYDGNGIDCIELEVSCKEEDICDINADCNYNATLRKNVCECHAGYEGNGRSCQLANECQTTADCGYHSVCDSGLCVCQNGYERDSSDFCVPAGSCNGAFCAENAICLYDDRQKVNYCYCPEGFIGDGVSACKSVPPPCNIRNNCGLYASCAPNYRTSTYACECDSGYFGDGFVCTLERNCANIPELCDPNAQCSSTTSGWKCICNQGFIGNGTICNQPEKLGAGFLIVSQGVAAVRIPLDGKRGVPVSVASMAIGIDKDCAEGRVYWSDISAKAIYSSKYDGKDKRVFINESIMSPEGVAVDWISRRIYWTDSGKDTIEVASLDNSSMRAVLINKGLVNPRGIAVDPQQNKVFWSDWNRNAPKIEWANLDGTEREVLVSSPQVKLPNSLALSSNSGEICYADAGNQKIECVDTYSRVVRVVAEKLAYPFGLAITDDHYYWSDWTTKKIESMDMYGVRKSGFQTSLFSSNKMYGMTAVIDRCPLYFSTCIINNGDCANDHICLVNTRSPSGKSCKCVLGGACNEVVFDE